MKEIFTDKTFKCQGYRCVLKEMDRGDIIVKYIFPELFLFVSLLDYLVEKSAGAVEYTDCIYSEGKSLPTSVLDMTLNNLMRRLQ